MKQEEVDSYIIEKYGITEQQWKLIKSDLFKGVKHYMKNPHEAIEGIYLNHFMTFHFKEYLFYKSFELFKKKTWRYPNSEAKRTLFYSNIFDSLDKLKQVKNERQASKKIHNEGSDDNTSE
jgi:hypothetical protein